MKIGDKAAFEAKVLAKNVEVGEEIVGVGQITKVVTKGGWTSISFLDMGIEVTSKQTNNTRLKVRRTGVIESIMVNGERTYVVVEYGYIKSRGVTLVTMVATLDVNEVELLEEVSA